MNSSNPPPPPIQPIDASAYTIKKPEARKAEELFNPALRVEPKKEVKVLPAITHITSNDPMPVADLHAPSVKDKRRGGKTPQARGDVEVVENIRRELGIKQKEWAAELGYAYTTYTNMVYSDNMVKVVQVAAEGLLRKYKQQVPEQVVKEVVTEVKVPDALIITYHHKDYSGIPTVRVLKDLKQMTLDEKTYYLVEV